MVIPARITLFIQQTNFPRNKGSMAQARGKREISKKAFIAEDLCCSGIGD
jgi:hypothetical protein